MRDPNNLPDSDGTELTYGDGPNSRRILIGFVVLYLIAVIIGMIIAYHIGAISP